MSHGGDDLDDDLVIDPDIVAVSDNGDAEASQDDLSADEDGDMPVASNSQAKSDTKKRKRREKAKLNKAKKRKLVTETGDIDAAEQSSFAAQSPAKLSEYLRQHQLRTLPRASALELVDAQIPEDVIVDTSSWTDPRTLDELPAFIMKALPDLHTRLQQKSKADGSPTLLFVVGAALRATDAARVLKDKRLRGEKGGDVAKLFARHFKLEDHVQYLKRTKIGAAAGTPGRIGKLLCDTDALKVDQLTHVVLDTTFRDGKKRTLLDIPETRDEVFKLVLGCPKLLARMKQGKLNVVLF